MKKITTFIGAVLLTASAYAQAPKKMSYQAVIRDVNQSLITNQSVGMQITIIGDSINGTPIYSEIQTPTANINGLVSTEIGTGLVVLGSFTSIDWSNGPYYILTETDPTGGSSYSISGTSQLMSVPYALYAENSGSSLPGPQGIQGLEGESAYDMWLSLGNTGNTSDFIASLTGPAGGPAGPSGLDGVNGIDGLDGAAGPQGLPGLDGVNGVDGLTAYQIAEINGFVGTESQWLASLSGLDGLDGVNGTDGIDGIDGAVGPQGPLGLPGLDGANGTNGTDGVDGLPGANGTDGIDGVVGAQGPIGATGVAGADGVDGIDGAVGPQGPIGVIGETGATGPAGSYTAGTGIDIAAGVISTTSTMPEFLFVQPDAIVSGYVGFGSASAVNGVPYNSVTDEFTLKAGKTYMLEGAVFMNTTTSSITYSFVFFDKTNNASIGAEAYQRAADFSGTIINQPMMNAIITPVTDIQVGIKDIYGSTGGFIPSRGFFKVVELK